MAAGVDVLSQDGTVLRLYYDGRFADDTQLHAGGVKASLAF